jgi:hypothetical protein
MGEFLGALVANPSIRRLGIVGLYESVVWSIAAPDESSCVFFGPVFLCRPLDWAIIQSERLFASLTVLLSRCAEDR